MKMRGLFRRLVTTQRRVGNDRGSALNRHVPQDVHSTGRCRKLDDPLFVIDRLDVAKLQHDKAAAYGFERDPGHRAPREMR